MKLSEKIKLLRTSHDMTQPDLASKAAVEQSYLSKLENDKGSPSFHVINKIAQAFGMTGMELINSLSQSYIEKNLSHLPEVAAEYASIRKQQLKKFKRGHILASLFVALGAGLFFYGVKSTWKTHSDSLYQSQGVIKSGETPYQFQKYPIKEIAETTEEHKIRLKNNRNRISIKQITLERYKGDFFITQVEGGRRMYTFEDFTGINKTKYNLISALGVMLMVAGLCAFLFNSKFKISSNEKI